MSMAKAVIQGVLVRDPETKFTPSGMAVCEFAVAVDRKKKDEKVTSFLDITAFGKRGEVIQQYFTKGKAINLCCTIEQQRWEKDGQKRSKIAFLMDDFSFVSTGKRNDQARDPMDQRPASEPEDFNQDAGGEDSESGLSF